MSDKTRAHSQIARSRNDILNKTAPILFLFAKHAHTHPCPKVIRRPVPGRSFPEKTTTWNLATWYLRNATTSSGDTAVAAVAAIVRGAEATISLRILKIRPATQSDRANLSTIIRQIVFGAEYQPLRYFFIFHSAMDLSFMRG